MTRRTALWRTDAVSVHRFDHAPDDHDHGPVDEIGDSFCASFVETGGFDLEVDGRQWRLGPGDLLLIHPGMRYRVAHRDRDLSDVCLSVNYNAADIDGFDRARTWARARSPVVRANNRLRYLHWGMRRALDRGTALLAETCASELFREIPESRSSATHNSKVGTLHSHAVRIHAVREVIDQRHGESLMLGDLAHLAGMSTFHFARVFSELVGMPPHRYLLQARLRAAADMLRQGRSATDTCFACGFNDPGHFSRAFARHFGVAPSAYALRPR